MVKNKLFILASTSAIILIFLFSYFSGTSLHNYTPSSSDEEKIVALLIRFQNARQDFDINQYLSCLDENGMFMYSGHLMVDKKELSTLLPDFWKGLKENNAHYKPMCRENINGNFLNGSFFDPIISIKNGTANATITFQTPIVRWRTLLFIDFKKEDGEWLITKFEWDMG